MSTFTIAEPLDSFDATDRRVVRLAPDHTAPLPLGYVQAVTRAVELRRKGVSWSWPVIASVMRDYHGFLRDPSWWAREVKARDSSLARPRGVPFSGQTT